MSFKPYVRKPLFHSERGQTVLDNLTGYLISTSAGEVKTTDPGQCLAALRVAKAHNIRCVVYGLGQAYSMETMEIVDEEFLLAKIGAPNGLPLPAQSPCADLPELPSATMVPRRKR